MWSNVVVVAVVISSFIEIQFRITELVPFIFFSMPDIVPLTNIFYVNIFK